MNNPLDSFGAPGVIDAAKEALEDGFFLAHQKHPQDDPKKIIELLKKIFEELNRRGGGITPEILAYNYEKLR